MFSREDKTNQGKPYKFKPTQALTSTAYSISMVKEVNTCLQVEL